MLFGFIHLSSFLVWHSFPFAFCSFSFLSFVMNSFFSSSLWHSCPLFSAVVPVSWLLLSTVPCPFYNYSFLSSLLLRFPFLSFFPFFCALLLNVCRFVITFATVDGFCEFSDCNCLLLECCNLRWTQWLFW